MKKCLALLFALVVLLSGVMNAYAANGTVTYTGNAGQYIFEPGSEYSPTDLFPDFKDVMPGDSLIQPITVKNEAPKDVKVNIYMRALGAHEDSEEFLSQLHLRVEKSEENTMAYMFDAAASETAQLTDWVCLGTLYSGGEVNLNVILDVPVELDNMFQQQIGYLDWEFRVEEYKVLPGEPEPPKTGDESQFWLWLALMALSAGAVILLLPVRKRRKDKN